MNYFAHGRQFVAEPYFLAGTAVPDWLSVVDRRVRVRRKAALLFVDDKDARLAAVARGIVRHHEDDDWFHRTPVFAELSWRFTAMTREFLSDDTGLRPSFLGHILVELLLDATLIAENPASLDTYYAAMGTVDTHAVSAAVNRMATQPTDRLGPLIPRFSAERFLYDYLDDAKLLFRLNQVMHRVKLPALPAGFRDLLPQVREKVSQRKDELLQPQSPQTNRVSSQVQ